MLILIGIISLTLSLSDLVFGNDLVSQAKSENQVIPSVLLKCIREVESRGNKRENTYQK